MRSYIYPQVEDKLVADGKANDDNAFDQMIEHLTSTVQDMAILDTLLKNWDKDGTDTERLLRFYPATSNKTARFNRYAI